MTKIRKLQQHAEDLRQAFFEAELLSYKVTNYFDIYARLFSHLRGEDCLFVETGVANGGSLMMWRKWLGPKARIIGIDMNPNSKKFEELGFQIIIGDQGCRNFWRECSTQIKDFDVFLDDGGHQSFQQIVTFEEVSTMTKYGQLVIEDTCTSRLEEFSDHASYSFLDYAKALTEVLVARDACLFPNDFYKILNSEFVRKMAHLDSITFFPGMVAFNIDEQSGPAPELIWNRKPSNIEHDYRYHGVSSAEIEWPDPYSPSRRVEVRGKQN